MSDHPRRVAVLLPSIELGAYWGPVITALDARVDRARIYTARAWEGIESDPAADKVTVVGSVRRVAVSDDSAKDYGGGVMALPPSVVWRLLRDRPDTIAVMGFSLWTILVLALRPLLRWTVVLMWEGSSPGVDHRDDRRRTQLRSILARRADHLLTSNQRSRRYLIDVLGAPASSVDVHPLLVASPDRMTAGETVEVVTPDATSPTLLAIGRLEPRKGVDRLVRALADLDDVPWSLTIVGRGEQEESLRALVAASGLEERVTFAGWVPYPSVGHVMTAVDLLAFPTTEDTWGMVALEAMALGTPVLCSVHAGVSEIITDGQDGVLVDTLDHGHMVAALRRALTETDLPAMGIAARTCASVLTPQATADAILAAASTP